MFWKHVLHNYWIKSNGIDAIYEKQKLDDSELRLIIENAKLRKSKRQKNLFKFVYIRILLRIQDLPSILRFF